MVSKIGMKIDSHIRAENMGWTLAVVKGGVFRRNGEGAVGRKPDFARPSSRPSFQGTTIHRAGPRQSLAAAGLGAPRILLLWHAYPRRF
jgi:hypothetical protein